jgi:hypothetical protein
MDSLKGVDLSTIDEDSLRKIDYKFESDVLSLPRIVTRLKFSVGDNVVQVKRLVVCVCVCAPVLLCLRE